MEQKCHNIRPENKENTNTFFYEISLYSSSYIQECIVNALVLDDNYLDIFNKPATIYKNLDKLLYIFSCIYYKKVTNKAITYEDFIGLNAQNMGDVLSTRYRDKILKFLKKHNFIESDNYYIKEEKNIGYRFGAKFRELAAAGELKFNKDLNLRIKIKGYFNNEDIYIMNLLKTLTIDLDLAAKLRQNLILSPDKVDQYEFVVDSVQNKNHFLTRGRKTNRMFNLITSIPKWLRPALIFPNDGKVEPVFNCDIKSCQPLLLCSLYKSKTKEYHKYKNLVESGNFYKSIVEFVNLEYNEQNKEYYKDLVWKWAFGKYVYKKIEDIDLYFDINFPELKAIILTIKKPKDKLDINAHAKLPILLQSIESSIMIDELIKFAAKLNIPLLPIHDSFLCHESNINKLIEEAKRIFKEKYNLNPNFNIQKL